MCRAGTVTACRSSGRSRRRYRAKGKNKDAIPINEFRRECRAFASHWIDVQREEFKRLGVEGDWEHPYTTMDFAAEAQIARELMKFAANGTLYRGSKPVMWSVVEKTALAEAEVEYEDYTSDTVWVKFPVIGGPAELNGASIVIWTTTPWTLPGNRAISFSSKISYALYEVKDAPMGNWANPGDKFLLADPLALDVMKQARVLAYERRAAVDAETLGEARLRASIARRHSRLWLWRAACSMAITSPTTPAPASFTPRPVTVATTSTSGFRMPSARRARHQHDDSLYRR